MKRKILLFITTIITIILVSGIILYIKKDKKNTFPHYKQAFYKIEGSMFVIKDTTFVIPLLFIDANEWSEMASAENIESLKILTDKGENINIKKWSINNKIKDTNYIIRSIDAEISINKEGEFKPNSVIITYKDKKIKKYDFGDFNIICNDKKYYENNLAGVSWDINPIISSKNNDDFPYSGLSLFIKGNKQNLEIKKIDLGIKSFGINGDNIKSYKSEYDLNSIMNYVEEGIKKNEKWAEDFNSIKVVKRVEDNIVPFNIEPETAENRGTNILIPLTRIEGSNMNGIKIFNIKVIVNISGTNKEILNFQPFYVIPNNRDKSKLYKILQEEGK